MPYSAVGMSKGLQEGLAGVRQRRRQTDQDDLNRTLLEARELREQQQAERAAMQDERNAELHSRNLEATDLGLSQARAKQPYFKQNAEAEADALRLGQERAQFSLESDRANQPLNQASLKASTAATQQSTASAQSRSAQEQSSRVQQADQEARVSLIRALRSGVSTDQARREYNRIAETDIDELTFDPETGNLSMRGPVEGQEFNATLDQLEAMVMPQGGLIKLGKDDRLVDPRTGQEAVGPSSGGRSMSTYNELSVQKDITSAIIAAHGGQAGEIESLTDPDSRDLVAYKNAIGTSLEDEFRQYFRSEGGLTARQVADVTLAASKDLETNNELRQRFEKEKDGWFSSAEPEDVDRAVEAERIAQRTKAEAKARAEVRRLVSEAQNRRAERGDGSFATSEVFQAPEWASGEPLGKADDYGLQPNQQQWFEDDSGNRIRLRSDSRGNVYEVGEDRSSSQQQESQAIGSEPQANARGDQRQGNEQRQADPVRLALSDARRGSGFTY